MTSKEEQINRLTLEFLKSIEWAGSDGHVCLSCGSMKPYWWESSQHRDYCKLKPLIELYESVLKTNEE